jgi:NAD(P)-dependent dehydrogenase (short-subunit alcohol dehydrogenase family)
LALITGSSRGLGLAMTQALSSAGAQVILNSRNADQAQEAAHGIAALTGNGTLAIQADVTCAQEVQAMVEETVGAMGPIDILVNSVGMNLRKPVEDLQDDEWDAVQAVLLRAPFSVAGL